MKKIQKGNIFYELWMNIWSDAFLFTNICLLHALYIYLVTIKKLLQKEVPSIDFLNLPSYEHIIVSVYLIRCCFYI